MNKPITISIVAPIYGVENYITKFTESVFSQSYPHIEFIFVNDGTKDNSIKVLNDIIDSKYNHLRPYIKIINKENEGLPAARNTGLKFVTGDYVCHVDSDDWLSANSIAKIAAKIEETNADVIYYNLIKEYPTRSKNKKERYYRPDAQREYVCNMYNHRSFASVCNKCFRVSLYKENVIYTPKYGYAEDCYVTTQLIGYSKSIAYLDEYVYHYRKGNPNALTGQRLRKRKKEYALNFIDLYEKYKDIPKEKNPVACIFDDILMQLGWYSIFYRLGFFKTYPWLAKAVRSAKIKRGSDVPILAQLFTKLVVLFK